MSGITGILNYHKKLNYEQNKIKVMTSSLWRRGPDLSDYYYDDHVMLGCQKLIIDKSEDEFAIYTYSDYAIAFDGNIYNKEQIKQTLIDHGFTFKTNSDEEVILKAFIKFKYKILDMLKGMYAFVIYHPEQTFIARDRLGVKPLFYYHKKNNFIFGSEIKSLFASDMVKPIINKKSLKELISLGPSRKPGSGVYKDIYELKPGHYLIYSRKKLIIKQYWKLVKKDYNDTFDEAVSKVKDLVSKSINEQLSPNIAPLLSGGLDSSIISAVASKTIIPLKTYSIDYEGNQKHFKSNSFQVSEDRYYIDIFREAFKNEHSFKVISQKKLARYLKDSMIARDLPGMADIDSSLLWFGEEIKKESNIILSGEGADEIFGGYPWFHNEELINNKGFPWMNFINKREELLTKKMRRKLKLKKTMYREYRKTIKEIPKDKNIQKRKHKELLYLNIKWFMPLLLERTDRITSYASLEARLPFIDYKLIEYLWDVPVKYKNYNNQEKGLLRESFRDLLPTEIINRKKNPYPKTHHPKYTKIITQLLIKRLGRPNTQFYKIFDKQKIDELLRTKGKSFTTPWFGQLMTGPQLIAYLYQFDLWLEEYEVVLKI